MTTIRVSNVHTYTEQLIARTHMYAHMNGSETYYIVEFIIKLNKVII